MPESAKIVRLLSCGWLEVAYVPYSQLNTMSVHINRPASTLIQRVRPLISGGHCQGMWFPSLLKSQARGAEEQLLPVRRKGIVICVE